MTIEWAIEHHEELMEDWNLCQSKQTPEADQAAVRAARLSFGGHVYGWHKRHRGFFKRLTARECGIFEALKDKTCFDQASVELGVMTWPHGADMDPGWMYEQVMANKSWSVPF